MNLVGHCRPAQSHARFPSNSTGGFTGTSSSSSTNANGSGSSTGAGAAASAATATGGSGGGSSELPASFAWTSTGPIIAPQSDAAHDLVAIKDPTVVFYDNQWHPDGPWTPLADSGTNPFAGANNVRFSGTGWTSDISHGELIRAGYDQTLTLDLRNLRLLYQGADPNFETDNYNAIPWRIGLASAVR